MVKSSAAIAQSKLATLAIDTAELADDAVTADKLANAINTSIAANTAKVTNATHTGDVTGATALTIAVDAVDIAMLSATGSASSSTFLRGDNAWQTPTDTVGADTSLSNLASAGADKIVKGWVSFDGDPLAIHDSFNVSSLTDQGVGVYDVNWDTDFANANYAVVAGGSASSGGGDYIQTQNTVMTSAFNRVYAYTGGGGTTWDPNYVSCVAIGDQ